MSAMPAPASVLVFGRDFQLVHSRSLILEKAGFHVRTAFSLPDIQQLSEPSMDVLLLCHSLSILECADALAITRERWPLIQSIALVPGSPDSGSTSADIEMESTESPAIFIGASAGTSTGTHPTISSHAKRPRRIRRGLLRINL
jgi:hypothetical protein